jgi:hypothetical protein
MFLRPQAGDKGSLSSPHSLVNNYSKITALGKEDLTSSAPLSFLNKLRAPTESQMLSETSINSQTNVTFSSPLKSPSKQTDQLSNLLHDSVENKEFFTVLTNDSSVIEVKILDSDRFGDDPRLAASDLRKLFYLKPEIVSALYDTAYSEGLLSDFPEEDEEQGHEEEEVRQEAKENEQSGRDSARLGDFETEEGDQRNESGSQPRSRTVSATSLGTIVEEVDRTGEQTGGPTLIKRHSTSSPAKVNEVEEE